jgi:pyruvate dehydrogenase complex dehydrogenase (E1) component
MSGRRAELGAALHDPATVWRRVTRRSVNPVIPFNIFYSMFGFQRTGDQMWASCDSMGRGFCLPQPRAARRSTVKGLSRDQGNGRRPGQAALGFGFERQPLGANKVR